MTVAGLALIIALAGTAMAAPTAVKSVLNNKEKKQVKGIATGVVNNLAGGLSVKSAGSATNATNATNANNANALGNIPASGFVQVKPRVFTATDNTQDVDYANNANLLQLNNLPAGQYVIQATSQIDNDEGAQEPITCELVAVAAVLDSQQENHGANATADVLTHVLIGTFTASAAGTDDVFIRCTDPATVIADADQEKIIATLINN
jgi:hypothetical protein